MASQQQVRSAPTYAFVTDYECDSNPAYGVVESRNQDSESPESGGRADPIPRSVTTETDTVSYDYMIYVYLWPVKFIENRSDPQSIMNVRIFLCSKL